MGIANNFREPVELDDFGCFERHGAFDAVFQFPYVSRPGVTLKAAKRLRGDAGNVFPGPFRVLAQEVQREQFDILGSFSQRGQLYRDHGDPIVEVIPKLALVDRPFQIAIGRGDYTHVHGHFGGAPQGPEFSLLKDPEQLDLHR